MKILCFIEKVASDDVRQTIICALNGRAFRPIAVLSPWDLESIKPSTKTY